MKMAEHFSQRGQDLLLTVTYTKVAYCAALELLDLVLADWSETSDLALVYQHRAACFAGLGDKQRAIEGYRKAVQAQRTRKGLMTYAHIDFSWLAATAPFPDLFEEALALLNEFTDPGMLPGHGYKTNAVRALIADARENRETAKEYARAALHADIGDEASSDRRVYSKLVALAG